MCDYVIVGAGSAGCVLAARLTEDRQCRVLLLEAGPPDRQKEIHIPAAWTKLFKTAVDWNYATTPQPALGGREIYWPRGRTLGGTSSINTQMHVRGNAVDYDGWAARGNPGWSYREVLPYFRRSEHNERGATEYRGTGGPLRISGLRDPNPATIAWVDAAVQAGFERCPDVNGARQDGVDFTQVTQRRGARCSTAVAYLKPARRRPNLTVVTGAHATRVIVEGGRATGVEYRHRGRSETARASREVILSGGTVNSPQLLMLSGIGPASHLRSLGLDVVADLPGVGRNLQDHLGVPVSVHCRRPVTLMVAETLSNLLRYLILRRGMLTSNVGEACAFFRSAPDLPAPDLELVFGPVLFEDQGLKWPDVHAISAGTILLTPATAGRLTLRSRDPLAAPRIDPAYLCDPGGEDLRRLVAGVRMARRVFEAPALAPFVDTPRAPGPDVRTDAEVERYIRQTAHSVWHPVGTCRMGTDDLAVVDPSLRVRGLAALRVVDASVMPVIVRGHTNSPTIMIAEKAADLIRQAAAPAVEVAVAAPVARAGPDGRAVV
jgi:choline dehydrogenase